MSDKVLERILEKLESLDVAGGASSQSIRFPSPLKRWLLRIHGQPPSKRIIPGQGVVFEEDSSSIRVSAVPAVQP